VDIWDGYGPMCLSSHFDKSLSVKKANEWVPKKLKPSRQSDFEHSGSVSQLHQLLKYPEERGLKHIYIPLKPTASCGHGSAPIFLAEGVVR